MWTCTKCGRIFEKTDQPHSCHTIPLEEHFKNKKPAKDLFEYLVKQINDNIGTCRLISLPCCIHLFGMYDFLALLPKKDRLEIRFSFDRKLGSPRIHHCVPVSNKYFKNCLDVSTIKEIDEELMGWLRRAYRLKDTKEVL